MLIILHIFLYSGAEWWFVVREPVDHTVAPEPKHLSGQPKEIDHDGGVGGIDLHWDKDVVLAGMKLPYIHPVLSTVTYLSEFGAPTIVLPVRRTNEGTIDEKCPEMNISYPATGKHLVFDGSLLHGVPESMNQSKHDREVDKGPRVTFLVNIWLRHRPFAVQRFPFSELVEARATMPCSEAVADIRACIMSSVREAVVPGPSATINVASDFDGPTSVEKFVLRVDPDGNGDAEEGALSLEAAHIPTPAAIRSRCPASSSVILFFSLETEASVLFVQKDKVLKADGSSPEISEPEKKKRKANT